MVFAKTVLSLTINLMSSLCICQIFLSVCTEVSNLVIHMRILDVSGLLEKTMYNSFAQDISYVCDCVPYAPCSDTVSMTRISQQEDVS